ncbi:2-amino-4-oxopentanoate thiolase subunit OrtA [Haloimpatiens massiliensis]|uniref:2-amino-4-oxopentanoate thiolase subunit OrtA n=1 Tax=Haloimpatiens massiliensis TaxID=1658110 RepID=UPI000C83CBF1|nr:2-amino-4-oxopentanoate thiolase subunit OrtA [Haloimpatiens massiliensis]
MIEKGTWVEITRVVLEPEERADNIPEDTKKTPLKMWVKGFCKRECDIGEEVEIETLTGRCEKGIVTDVEPRYVHDFGEYVREISLIGIQARKILSDEK